MSGYDFVDIADEVLQAELDRRARLRNAPWPRRTTVTLHLSDEDDLGEFLVANCGFIQDSDSYSAATTALESVEVEVEIYETGDVRVVRVLESQDNSEQRDTELPEINPCSSW